MTIYLVTSGSYSDYSVDAAFSTEEKADAHVADLKKCGRYDVGVEEYEVDVLAEETPRERFYARIDLDTGFVEVGSRGYDMARPTARGVRFDPPSMFSSLLNPGAERELVAYSYVSIAHAEKLAVEARQRYRAAEGISLNRAGLQAVIDRLRDEDAAAST